MADNHHQSDEEDEKLAKQLQSEENEAVRQREQEEKDAEFARQLDQEERRRQERVIITQVVPTRGPPMLKLHQTSTGRQIGETLLAHYVLTDEVAFELATRRGYYLRIRESGAVEFTNANNMLDEFNRFKLLRISNGSCFLMCKAYMNSTNSEGGRGWYLTILPNGQLTGNGPRNSLAEWSFVMLQNAPTLLVPPGGGIVGSPVPAMPMSPTPAAVASGNPTAFPGLGAGREELMKFFATPAGMEFLHQSEYRPSYELYQRNGLLSRILHRPDWPYLASRFRDYASETVPFSQQTVDTFTPFPAIKQFFASGWTQVANVCSPESLAAAKKIINFWNFKYMNTLPGAFNGLKRSRGYTVECCGDISWDMELLSLYYNSALPSIMQQLFGIGEVDNPKQCRPLMIFPTLDLTDDPALFGDKWWIEGFTKESHSPYNLLIGIALTDQSEHDQGNYCVHPGSHITLLEQYKKKAEARQTLFSENPYQVMKPDLGLPTQIKLKAGDAFFCTQRLAHLLARNTKSDPSMFVFFEISHVDHPVLKDPALTSMWLEYKNVAHYLGDENAGIILTPTEVVTTPLPPPAGGGTVASPPAVAFPSNVTSPYGAPRTALSPSSGGQLHPVVGESSVNPMQSGNYVPAATTSPGGGWHTYDDNTAPRPSNNIELSDFSNKNPNSTANPNNRK